MEIQSISKIGVTVGNSQVNPVCSATPRTSLHLKCQLTHQQHQHSQYSLGSYSILVALYSLICLFLIITTWEVGTIIVLVLKMRFRENRWLLQEYIANKRLSQNWNKGDLTLETLLLFTNPKLSPRLGFSPECSYSEVLAVWRNLDLYWPRSFLQHSVQCNKLAQEFGSEMPLTLGRTIWLTLNDFVLVYFEMLQ